MPPRLRTLQALAPLALLSLCALRAPLFAQSQPLVEFEMMTWPEVKQALAAGKTTALVFTGGTEQRGPQNVNGGHTLMARATAREIALRLGNALVLPVLPYTPNNASAELPGTIGLTPELLGALLERITDQAVATGFKNVVFLNDHGGGLNVYDETAQKLDARYQSQGVRVIYAGDVYTKSGDDFEQYSKEHNLPLSSHAGIPDTSEMLYLGDSEWVRKDLIATAVGTNPDGSNANNGISGDARKSSKELGKLVFDMKVANAVKQIQAMLAH